VVVGWNRHAFLESSSLKRPPSFQQTRWDHVYGFDMGPMKDSVMAEAQVDIVPGDVLASPPIELISWDLQTCGQSNLDFIKEVEVPLRRGLRHHALVIWFDTVFAGTKDVDGVDAVTLSTSPLDDSTHWKQTILLFNEPLEVLDDAGGKLKAKLTVRKGKSNARELVIDGLFEVVGTREDPTPEKFEQKWYVR